MFVYSINKSSSFLNDSIIIRDPAWGVNVYYFVNTTGASPWNTSAPMTYGGVQIISDAYLQSGNYAAFGTDQYKLINGTDTIYNINNFYMLPVTNPCSFDTVKGKIYIDQNSDCVFNAGDLTLGAMVTANATLSSPNSYATFNGFPNSRR